MYDLFTNTHSDVLGYVGIGKRVAFMNLKKIESDVHPRTVARSSKCSL